MSFDYDDYLQLAPGIKMCRILNGMWQVSGGHGVINSRSAVHSMFAYHEAGFTTWDLADHYGPAEDFIGQFRRQLAINKGEKAVWETLAFTKWVPSPGQMTRKIVEDNINLSLRRMGVQALDMLQFHWWDYSDNNYLEALKYLAELQNEGKIHLLSLTNFDTAHLQIILDKGIKIATNQVQFSPIDMRPLVEMTQFCEEHDIKLLTYGTVCGGLLSDRYLNQSEPGGTALNTVSLRKYKQMVDGWGGWKLFQQLLQTLKRIAVKHNVSISNVAIRYILNQTAVGGVIVGARLGIAEHIEDNARVFKLKLDGEDKAALKEVLSKSNDLYQLLGDCGAEYRR
ncbi:aldo/keto reductase [Candidatus Chlorohelix sp.]|uniref:aldo/keto reductase n=1 Tax=Candidatus Chlorohelix sp. TaxID=3139201 RepID=UPI00302D2082